MSDVGGNPDGNGAGSNSETVRVGTFAADVTPSVGDPIAYGEAEAIDDPLQCRGLVLLSDDLPIVLAAVDWIGNYNGGHDVWRLRLAEAAGTSPERVAVHCVHQHDAPGFDADAQTMLHAHGAPVRSVDAGFAYGTIDRVADAVADAAANAVEITHVGWGTAEVEKVASNRQLLGPDGTIAHVRYSSEADPAARAAPEGIVDPRVSLLTFWRDDEPVAASSYYACHPQSHYGEGRVSCDFPGLARSIAAEETGTFLAHFCGAAGNVAAGKYNDGSPEKRQVLAERLADGIVRAWENSERTPVTNADLGWRVRRVGLPPADDLDREELAASLDDDPSERTARRLVWLDRCERGHEIPVACLRVGNARILHAPGELFVEYQLAARRMRPDLDVAMAAYGDGGPGYIGTRTAYPKGGYEVGDPSLVAPTVEDDLVEAFRDLLDATESNVAPSDITDEKPLIEGL